MAQKLVALVLLVSMMLSAGFQLDPRAFRAVPAKWSLLLRAFAANFVVVPIVAVLVVWCLHLRSDVATGLMLMAIAPGVPFLVLSAGRKRGGSHELAIALSLLMPALSTVTIPITAGLVFPASERLEITAAIVVPLLLYQLVPLLAGAVVARQFPRVAERLLRPLTYVTIGAFLVLLVILFPAIVRGVASVFGTLGLLAMVLTAALSFLIGWIAGGPRIEYRRTLAAGTTLRNPAAAMMIATTSFAARGPAAAVASYFLVQIVVATAGAAAFKKWAGSSQDVDSARHDESDATSEIAIDRTRRGA
jgi:BASS family bile acid:Na+ symporter